MKVNEYGFQARLITGMLPIITGKKFRRKERKRERERKGNESREHIKISKENIGENIKISKIFENYPVFNTCP